MLFHSSMKGSNRMELLEKLARDHVVCKTDSPATRQYYGELKHLLPQKKHRVLLLRYTDEKNLLCENAAYENFKLGLYLGLRLAAETYGKAVEDEKTLYPSQY